MQQSETGIINDEKNCSLLYNRMRQQTGQYKNILQNMLYSKDPVSQQSFLLLSYRWKIQLIL
jgi:hypothetical protein